MPNDDPAGPYVSDTKEIVWNKGTVTIDTARSHALTGFIKGRALATQNLAAEVKNDFCAITLSSLDAKPLARSSRMLLTATAREQNTGAKWNERHTLWEQAGTAPTLIEPVTGWVLLRDIEGAVAINVTAMDGASNPIGQPARARRLEAGREFEIGAKPATSYVIEPVR